MTDSLPALIARLEAADAGSRELSDEALLAHGWTRKTRSWPGFIGPAEVWTAPGKNYIRTAPAPDPTCSLDDALRWLVPEGWRWLVERRMDAASPEYRYRAAVMPQKWLDVLPTRLAATPALALCAAALRAKGAGQEGEA